MESKNKKWYLERLWKMALIYIVEDDQNIREIESFALKNSGYQVSGYECARDFFHQIAEKVPDLILLDIMLPDEA